MQPNRNVAGWDALSFTLVGFDQHLLNDPNTRLDRFSRATALLHHHGPKLWACSQTLSAKQSANLAAFTAEADNQGARDVWVPDVPGQSALQ